MNSQKHYSLYPKDGSKPNVYIYDGVLFEYEK